MSHQTGTRGNLAPKKNWNQEENSEDQRDETKKQTAEEEEDIAPRRNRETNQKQPFKVKLVPRETDKNDNRGKEKDKDRNEYQYKKEYKLKDEGAKNQDETKQRQNNREGDREPGRQNQRNNQRKNNNQREKKEVGKGAERPTKKRQDDDERQDYDVEQLPRKPLPNYTNKIDIKNLDTEKYVKEAKDMLNKFDFITLRGVRNWIGHTFSVAEAIVKEIKSLDRINIPATDKIEERLIPRRAGLQEKRRTRYIPMIIIELSKNELTSKHIGHQSYKNTEYATNYKRPQRRPKHYQEKKE